MSPWSVFPGPEFATENDDCIFVGMVTEDVDVTELVNTIGAIGRDIEENGRVTFAFILKLLIPLPWTDRSVKKGQALLVYFDTKYSLLYKV